MFKVKKFDVCPLTRHVDYEIEFSVFGGPARINKGTYSSKSDAERKIEVLKRDYILFTIESYVSECKRLFDFGISTNRQSRPEAIAKCISCLHYLQDKELSIIAATIIKMEEVLKYILPPESCDRYNFLFSQKMRLINFSKELTSQKQELCRV